MRTFFRRAAAFVLCAALLIPTPSPSRALASRIYSYTLPLCDDTSLTR